MTRVGPGTGGFLTAMVVDALGSGVWITFSLLYFTDGQGMSLTSAGAALSAGALTALVLGGLAVGVLTDWLGPYAAATLSCAIRAVAFPCYLFADGPVLVAATAFVVSFGDRLYWAAHGGLVEDVTSSGYERRQLFALLNSLRNVGLGVGALSVALGAALERAESTLFWHAIPLANAASFAVAGVLFRRVGGRDRPVGTGATGPGLTSYRAVVADHRFLVFTGATLALTLASVGFDSILPIYLWSLGLPLWLPPAAYVLSCVAIPASQPVALRLGQRRPAMALMALAAVLIASALSGLVALHWLDLVGEVVLTAGLVLVFSLGEAISGAVVMTIVLSFAARGNVGRYSAFYQLAWGLSGALGPGLHTWLFSVSSNAPWLTVTGALLVSTALYLRLARTGPEPAETAAPPQLERKNQDEQDGRGGPRPPRPGARPDHRHGVPLAAAVLGGARCGARAGRLRPAGRLARRRATRVWCPGGRRRSPHQPGARRTAGRTELALHRRRAGSHPAAVRGVAPYPVPHRARLAGRTGSGPGMAGAGHAPDRDRQVLRPYGARLATAGVGGRRRQDHDRPALGGHGGGRTATPGRHRRGADA
ncbi:MAG: MFS transporter [Pseudonocardiales bacterium]|nr:MFS transporter [Pseudonocardiales bacterium]